MNTVRHPRTTIRPGLAALAAFGSMALASAALGQTFSNPAPIAIPGVGSSGPALPYPSPILVSGVTSATSMYVQFFGLTHTYPQDIDVLLVAPNGQTCVVMSDVGGILAPSSPVNLRFQDGFPTIPTSELTGVLVSGTYGPSNALPPFGPEDDNWGAPLPAGPYGSTLGGLLSIPNGVWSLYITDDVGGDVGTMGGGWSVTFVPSPGTAALLGLGGLAALRRRRA